MKEIKVVKIPRQEPTISEVESPRIGRIITLDAKKTSEQAVDNFIGDVSNPEYKRLLQEIIIRFNTEPKKYEKQDFEKLIQTVIGGFVLTEKHIEQVYNDLLQLISDTKGELITKIDTDVETLKQYLLSRLSEINTNLTSRINEVNSNLDSKINTKVDKESGKSLMSNEEHQKLAGIEAGGQANIIEGVKLNGEDLPIDSDKKVLIENIDPVLINGFTVNSPLGGISNGTTYNKGTKLEKIIKDLLYKYIVPTFSISNNKTVNEKGSTITPTIKYKATDSSSAQVTKLELLLGSESIETKDPAVSGIEYTYTCPEITSNTTYKLEMTDSSGAVNSASTSISFYYPIYKGLTTAAPDTFGTSNLVGKSVTSKPGTLKVTGDGSTSRIFFALPSGWTMKSLIDNNGFNVASGYETKSITVDTTYESNVSYTLYILKEFQSNGNSYNVTLTLN